MGRVGLTARQAELLRYIESCGPISPTFRQMARAMRTKSNGHIAQFLDQLEAKGHIRRLRNRAQAIEVLRPTPPPIVHQVTGPFASLTRDYRALPEKPVACPMPYPFVGHRRCSEWMQAEAA